MNSSQQLLERQHPRLAVDQRQEDDRKRVLQRRELVELVEHDLGIGVALQLEDQPHRLLQVALVAHRRNALDPVFVHQRRDPLFHAVARLLVRNLVDDDPVPSFAAFFDVRPGPQRDRAAAGVIAAANAAAAADDAAGGKIGAGADLQQLVDRDARARRSARTRQSQISPRLCGGMRGGHAHRDAVGAVDQQVGKLRRQHRRLGAAARRRWE